MGVFLFGQPFYNLQLLTSNSSIDPEDCCSMENNFFFYLFIVLFSLLLITECIPEKWESLLPHDHPESYSF